MYDASGKLRRVEVQRGHTVRVYGRRGQFRCTRTRTTTGGTHVRWARDATCPLAHESTHGLALGGV
jgi:hypothetical protein